MDASPAREIKSGLKDSEMIQKMNEILTSLPSYEKAALTAFGLALLLGGVLVYGLIGTQLSAPPVRAGRGGGGSAPGV